MNLPVILSFASAGGASIFVLSTLFSRRNNIPQWIFSLGMLALAVEQLLSGLAQISSDPIEVSRYVEFRFYATAFLPSLWLSFSATYSRGQFKSHFRKRIPIILTALAIPLALVFGASEPLARLSRDTEKPLQWIISLQWPGFLLHVALLLSMIGSLVGLERTFRASVGTLRWKIKFMLYGLGTLFAARFFTSSQIVLAERIEPALETINAAALILCCLLVGRSVLRKGTFEIDLYPSKSIISGSLVITLAGGYLIVVGVLSKVIEIFGGDQAYAIQALLVLVALVGLFLLIQSDRVRQSVRRFVSRHFQRPLYDYRTLWLKVTAATSQSVREKDICESTTKLLSNLFDTKLTNVWLLEPNGNKFSLEASSDQETQFGSKIDSEKIQAKLLEYPDPLDLDKQVEKWKTPIQEYNPSKFSDGGNRILVPLTGQGNVVGFIVLGDRTNTLRFTQQEFDTISCIGNHIAASLLSAALTRKLEESKEIEAFQTMATFFVHDLKNAVSTLNLMLKNMPLHWDNPEFREDALRGIGSTSNRITDLITRLSQVRHELNIVKKPVSLKAVADSAISEWKRPGRIDFSDTATINPTVLADETKLRSVILNLVINATEAIEGNGSISLDIALEESHAVLSITDSGSGMNEEFIRNSLFRPFKTTKNSGLGIGMFQSKTAIEAIGGSIEVDSQEGKGSTFSVRLPLEPDRSLEEKKSYTDSQRIGTSQVSSN